METIADLTIRPESIGDYDSVRRINEHAFKRSEEAKLVDALRQDAQPNISLVAVQSEQVIGHIFFSPVEIISASEKFAGMALAPMAVDPDYQKQGVGGQLVEAGLEKCRQLGHDLVFVLGHPEYYPKFGFERASTWNFKTEFEAPDEAFMVAALQPEALHGKSGLVRFHHLFNNVA